MQDDINYDKKGRVSSPFCPLGWSVRVSLTMGCSLCSALCWYPFTTGGMEKVDPTHVLGGQSKLCLWTTHLLKQHIRKKQTEWCAYDLHGAIIGKKKKKVWFFQKLEWFVLLLLIFHLLTSLYSSVPSEIERGSVETAENFLHSISGWNRSIEHWKCSVQFCTKSKQHRCD